MSKIRHILSVIHYTIRGAVCFQFTHFPCDHWENIYILCLIILFTTRKCLLSMPSHHTLTSLSYKTSKPVKHICDSQIGAINTPGLFQYIPNIPFFADNVFTWSLFTVCRSGSVLFLPIYLHWSRTLHSHGENHMIDTLLATGYISNIDKCIKRVQEQITITQTKLNPIVITVTL